MLAKSMISKSSSIQVIISTLILLNFLLIFILFFFKIKLTYIKKNDRISFNILFDEVKFFIYLINLNDVKSLSLLLSKNILKKSLNTIFL